MSKRLLFINMASGFGGGEFQTEQLILSLSEYEIYFFGKSKGKLAEKLKISAPNVKAINFFQLIKLMWVKKPIIVHAQDGRGAHIAGGLKRLFNVSTIITRHVSFPFKRKSSLYAYQSADALVGVSQQITDLLKPINANSYTIYGCIKPLMENAELESKYFASRHSLSVAHIGNLQEVKNFPLTLNLAKNNPNIHFYIVGSGVLEDILKSQAASLNNVTFIPFTEYIGSVFKSIDLQIVPSHSEGLGGVILEGYCYQVPVLAHATGGIPEIVKHHQTGFLSQTNDIADYQEYLNVIQQNPEILTTLKTNIQTYLDQNQFSNQQMADQYMNLYENIFKKLSKLA